MAQSEALPQAFLHAKSWSYLPGFDAFPFVCELFCFCLELLRILS